MKLRFLMMVLFFTMMMANTLYASGETDMQPAIFKDSKEQVPAGTSFDYYVKLQNNTGIPTDANVELNISIPSGFTYERVNSGHSCVYSGATPSTGAVGDQLVCTFTSPFPGNSYQEVNITVKAGPVTGVFKSYATVNYAKDTNKANDQENTKTTVIPSADMEIVTMLVNPTPEVISGGIATYTTKVTNNGPYGTNTVSVKYVLPSGFVFAGDDAATPDNNDSLWACSETPVGTITCDYNGGSEFTVDHNSTFNFRLKATNYFGDVTLVGEVDSVDNIFDINTSNNFNDVNVTILEGTNLKMEKSVDKAVFIEGEVATFTLKVSNTGYVDAPNVVVRDTIPIGHTFVESNITAPADWNCTVAGQYVECKRDGNLSKGTSETITIKTTTPTMGSDKEYKNWADINSTTLADADLSDNNASSISYKVRVDQLDIGVDKVKVTKNNPISGNPVTVGDNIISTISVKNYGPRDATSGQIRVNDKLDVNESYVGYSGTNWSCTYSSGIVSCIYNAALANGITASDLNIETTALQAGVLDNEVEVNTTSLGTPGDHNSGNDNKVAEINATATNNDADIVVTKTSNKATVPTSENNVTYQLLIQNKGPGSATNILVSDNIPQYYPGYGSLGATSLSVEHNVSIGDWGGCTINGGEVRCTINTLEANKSVEVNITVSGAMLHGTKKNTASAFSNEVGDSNRSNNQDDTNLTVAPKADVQVIRNEVVFSEVRDNKIKAGTDALYYIQIQNNGPAPAQDVNLTNLFDTSIYRLLEINDGPYTCSSTDGNITLKCAIGTLDPKETANITLKLRPIHYNTPPKTPWELNNSVSVETSTFDMNHTNDELNETLPITYGEVDISIEKDESEIFIEPVKYDPDNNASNIIVYKITINNFGPSEATNVKYIDKVVNVSPDDHNMTFLGDTNNSNGSDYNLSRHCTPPSPATFEPNDNPPEINCSVPGILQSKGKYERYLVFHVDAAPHQIKGDVYHDEVNVTCDQNETEAKSNEEDEKTTVRTAIDLNITKTSTKSPVEVGEDFNFTFYVENDGPGYAPNTQVKDFLPTGMKIVGTPVVEGNSTNFPGDNGSCLVKDSNTTLECNLNDKDGVMRSNEWRRITVPVRFTTYTGGVDKNTTVLNRTWVRSNDDGTDKWKQLENNTSNNDGNESVIVHKPIHIGDKVWHDRDADGVQDGGAESGIEGVVVRLYKSNGDLVATTETNSSGEYGFDVNSSGNYYVEFNASNVTHNSPDGDKSYDAISPKDKNTTDNLDSDIFDSNKSTPIFFAHYGDNNLSLDAGFYDLAELGDRIWIDIDGDGKQDSGEGNYTGSVTVKLYKEGNATVQETNITTNGSYLFKDLIPGNYYVEFNVTDATYEFTLYQFSASGINNTNNSDANRTTGKTPSVNLESGEKDTTLDAGVYKAGVDLGDTVWLDYDGDGIQDHNASEKGVAGVIVKALNTYTNQELTTTTDENGTYLFKNIIPGPYVVTFDINSTYRITQKNAGSDDTNDSDANATTKKTDTIILVSGENNMSVDAGIYKPVKIGDQLWWDKNGNGKKDDANNTFIDDEKWDIGRTGQGVNDLAGVTVTLVIDGVLSSVTTMTDSNGYYLFDNLAPGHTYGVKFARPISNAWGNTHKYHFTTPNADADHNDSDANLSSTTTSEDGGYTAYTPMMYSGDSNLTLDAGVYMPIEIGNYVWEDLNYNGKQDSGEPKVKNVVAYAVKDGTVLLDKNATTANNGEYYLHRGLNLPPDHNYSVYFDFSTIVGDWYVTKQNQGSDDKDNDANSTGYTGGTRLYSNDTNHTFDLGIYRKASLGNRVWLDDNGNGIQDSGEANVSDINVTLYDENNISIASVKTDSNGSYSFKDLNPGYYYVEFNLTSNPLYAGYRFTEANVTGATQENNSDANVTTGKTQRLFLQSGENNTSLDAGIFKPASIGDRAWIDANGNGVQESGEHNLSDVNVTLWSKTTGLQVTEDLNGTTFGTLGTIETNATGGYLFKNLKPDTYFVKFQAPTESGTGRQYVITVENNTTKTDDNDSDTNTTGQISGQTGDYILSSGEDNRSVDAGFYIPVKVGDRVWIDKNYNGIQDANESNLSGVTVKLYNETHTEITQNVYGASFGTVTTDTNGTYLFENLPAGHSYYVKFDLTDLNNSGHSYRFTQKDKGGDDTNDSDANNTTFLSDPTPIMKSGEQNLTLDAGVYEPVIIGDRVWYDANANGIQDSGESGVAGVKVFLIVDSTLSDINTTTNASGDYLFGDSFDLKPNKTYSVKFVLPSGSNYVFTYPNAVDSNDTNDSDANRSTGVATHNSGTMYSNDENRSFDAGVFIPAHLGNKIWYDNDGDGFQDASENGVADVNITLYDANGTQVTHDHNGTALGNRAIAGVFETNSSGEYYFNNLRPGKYFVKFNASTIPSGFIFTEANASSDSNDTLDSDVNATGFSFVISLESNETNHTIDAGIYKPASIGDYTWIDENGDGVQQTTEANLPDVNVTLWYKDSGGNEVQVLRDLNNSIFKNGNALGVVTTDVNGSYLFDNLRPRDNYYLKFTAPKDIGGRQYVITVENNLTKTDDNDSDTNTTGQISGQTGNYVLSSGEDNRSVDAGFYIPVKVGDRVWVDRNFNGIQESGEQNLSGVKVTIYYEGNTTAITKNVYGDPIGVAGVIETNVTGGYLFTNLPAGHSYYVKFDLADYNTTHNTNYRFTAKNTTSDALDSDANNTTFLSDPTPIMKSGEENLTLDAGVYQPVTIGDRVWHDANGNGLQDSGEVGLAGITVRLIIDGVLQDGTGGTRDLSIDTNATGGYLFGGSYDLKPDSNYSVQFTKPIGSPYVFTIRNTNSDGNDTIDSDANLSGMSIIATPKMDSNESNLTLDAGMYIPAQLGDRVWVDKNGNGIQDNGEANVSGVKVYLFDKNDNPVTKDLYGNDFNTIGHLETNSSGEYLFTNLRPDSYYVKFVLPNDKAGYRFTEQNISGSTIGNNSDANITTGRTVVTTLDSNESDRTWDGGIYKPVSIGDYAWVDVDGNGDQNASEPFLAGVKVSLFKSDGTPVTKDLNGTVLMTETNATGGYLFSNLKPDTYFVKFEAPTGSKYVLTLNNHLGGDDANDSDTNVTAMTIGRSGDYTIASGEHEPSVDVGFYIPASLGNFIWIDENGDGLQQPTEATVQDANVTLWYDGNDTQVTHDIFGNDLGNSSVVGTFTTGVDGNYSFTNLRPDSYYIKVVAPNSSYKFTIQNAQLDGNNTNDSDINPANGESDAISLESDEDNTTLDAGLIAPVTIGDRIWIDSNANGIQDSGESDYNGSVTVKLIRASDNVEINTTTVTDGNYSFKNVVPERYYIKFEIADSSYFVSPKNVGSDTNDSDTNASGYIAPFDVTSGDDNLTLDMGIYQKAKLGDRVWYDDNGNGMQDGGESGVSDVNVTLYNGLGIKQHSVKTDASGNYLFDGLDPGSYYVEFNKTTLLPTFVFTEANATGSSESNNSDANRTTGLTQVLILTSGEDNRTLDAGIFEPVSIGDYTWDDVNGDGRQDANESNLSGVKVTLFKSDGTQVKADWDGNIFQNGDANGTIITDANGSYLFTNLKPDTYYVKFVAPSGYVLTLNHVVGVDDAKDSDTNVTAMTIGRSGDYELTSREHNRSVDAGFYQPVVALGDRVWLDRNGNGLQDNNESGVQDANVTLWRYDGGGNPVQVVTNIDGVPFGSGGTITTNSDGNYSFTRIKPDTYFIKVVAPNSSYIFTKHNAQSDSNDSRDSDIVIATGRSDDLVFESDEENLTLDAGLYLPLKIGDRVWIDLNANGIQESGEGNYTGNDINATLYYEANNSIAQKVAVTNGKYEFNNVLPERYYIKFDIPNNYFVSPKDNAGGDLNDSDVNTTGFTSPFGVYSNTDDLSFDMGIFQKATIGDRIWYDTDMDGIQDPAELNVTMPITVKLRYEGNGTIAMEQTVNNGSYKFINVIPNNYVVEFSLPNNYALSPRGVGGDDTKDSDVNATTMRSDVITILNSGDLALSVDMGIYELASIGDRIWIDTNANGIQDATEPNYSGSVTVTLYDALNAIVDTQITTNGTYHFTKLTPATYSVGFTLPSGYVVTTKGVGGANDSDADTLTLKTTPTLLEPGENDLTWDMGLYQNGSLGDRIWHDLNANGIQDNGEPNINESITVTLYDGSGNKLKEMITANGSYVFDGLRPSSYQVGFSTPKGYFVSPQYENNDTLKDSNVNGSTLKSEITVIDSGEHDASLDMGLYKKASLGNRIWIDSNGDGIQDANESNANSPITVTLYNQDGQIVASQETLDGNYLFEDLIPSSYKVGFVLPQGFSISVANKGEDATLDSDVNPTTRQSNLLALISDEHNMTLDMGIYQGASLGDRIWLDTNANGVQDDNETTINEEINVTLYDSNGTKLKTFTTTDGSYLFDGLAPSEYFVEFTLPKGYFVTSQNSGNDEQDSDVNATTMRSDTIVLSSNDVNLSIDMGLYKKASIGNRIWFDSNANGIQESDEANVMESITVELYDAQGNLLETQTTTDGNYLFEDLVPQGYFVKFTMPQGYYLSPRYQGGNEEFDSDVDETSFTTHIHTLSSNEQNLSLDMGLYQKASIGDRVWFDSNSNGIQEDGEAGVGGIAVTLFDALGNELATTTTDAQGYYLFDNLLPSSYKVVFSGVGADYLFTTQNQGGDSTLDSNVDSKGASELIVITSNQSNLSIDAGLRPVVSANDDFKSGKYQEPTTVNIHENDNPRLLPLTTELTLEGLPKGSTVSEDKRRVVVPNEGVWTLDSSGNITFTPNKDFFKDPTPIEYQSKDGSGNIATARVTIDYPPMAMPDIVERECSETTYMADVLANDITDEQFDLATLRIVDPDGNLVEVYDNPEQGVWFVQNGQILFDALEGYTGKITPITYTVQEEDGDSIEGQATISISFPEVRDDIVVASDSAIAGTDRIVVDIFANDPILTPNLDTLQITGTQNPGDALVVEGEGVWSIEGDKIVFTPQSGFLGDPTPIEYSVSANRCGSKVASFAKVSVFYPLLTRDDNATTQPGKPVSIDIHRNDNGNIDVSKTRLSIPDNFPIPNTTISTDGKKITVPGEGIWEIDENGIVTFTPDDECKDTPTPITYIAITPDGSKTSTSTISIDMGDDCLCAVQHDSASSFNVLTIALMMLSTIALLYWRRKEEA